MFRFSMRSRAGLGVLFRGLLEAFSGARRGSGAFETRETAARPLAANEPAPEPPPSVETRRGGRLIDLERRAKFGQFGS